MYHYAKYTLIGLIIAAIVIFLTVDAIKNKTQIDLGVVIASGYTGFGDERLSALRELAEEVVGDVDGDGEVNIDLYFIDLTDGNGVAQYDRFELVLSKADDEYLLFLLDDLRSKTHGERGDFDGLMKFGFEVSEDEWYRLYVGDSPAIQAFPKAPETTNSYRFTDVEYASLQTWKANGTLGEKRAEAAVRLLKALVEYDNFPAE